MSKIEFENKTDVNKYMTKDDANEIKRVVNENDDSHLAYPDINLPFDDIFVAIGRELNVWKDNLRVNNIADNDKPHIVFEVSNLSYTISHNKEAQYQLIPDTISNSHITFYFYNKNLVELASIYKNSILKITGVDGGIGNKQYLFCGDSLMAQQRMVTETGVLLDSEGVTTRTFLGTRGSTGYKHEGYGTRTWEWFNSSESPFWNSTSGKVDFADYMTKNGFTGDIDFFLPVLGINDVTQSSYSNYPLTDEWIADIMENCLTILNQLLLDYPNCKIIFNLEPIGGTQDGAVYSSPHLRRKMLQLFDAYYAEFTKAEWVGKLYINPAYIWVDPIYGYPLETVNRSSRETSIQVVRQTDCIHTAESGDKQIADSMYSAIRYLLSLE